jgi:LuxR family maltose regulon positive regulatory protein
MVAVQPEILGTDPRLAMKLAPPRLPPGLVDRARLVERLESAARTASVTLVSAPAGFGKTVLATAWAASTDLGVAWVTVDVDDNAGGRFWDAATAAMVAACGAEGPRRGTLDDTLAAAAGATTPVVLVLDDLHELADRETLGTLDRLLRYAPNSLHVLILTRSDPPLSLNRMRVAGELAEIRAGELAFDESETAQLAAALAPELDEGTVRLVHERTEGWPAAVRFGALSLADLPDPRAALTTKLAEDRAIADYLLAEVFEGETPVTRDFLLRTSVADWITPDLAEAVTGSPDAAGLLDDLARRGLLVSGAGNELRWCRYHHLFRDFLRLEAHRRLRSELGEIHTRVAQWEAANRLTLSAVRHAAEGRAWDLENELVLEHWRTLLLSESTAGLALAVDRIDPVALREHPALALLAAIVLARRGETIEAERCAAVADAASESSPDLRAFSLMCRSTIQRLAGETQASLKTALTLLDAQPTSALGRTEVRLQQRALAFCSVGIAEVWEGRLAAAVADLEHALELSEQYGGVPTVEALGYLGLADCADGQLRRGARHAAEAFRVAESRAPIDAPELVGAHLTFAWSFYQWDELDKAREHAETALGIARHAGDVSALTIANYLAALADTTPERGLRRLQTHSAETACRPPLIAERLLAGEARLLLADGDVDGARAMLDRLTETDRNLLAARLHLLEGRPWEAIDALGPEGAPGTVPVLAAIEAALLEGVARSAVRDGEGSRQALETALALAAPDSYRRIFVEGGPTVRSALVEHVRRGTAHRAFVGELHACFDRRGPRVDLSSPQLLEPLSPRERAVLAYLPTMMSNGEIASELFLSVNTVKTHLRSIYRKLGTNRRREAVELARKLQLL